MNTIRLLCGVFMIMLAVAGISMPTMASDGFEPTTLAEVRSDVEKLLSQLQTFDNQCVIILPALVAEIDSQILHLRKLIATKKLDRFSFQRGLAAVNNGSSIVTDNFNQCRLLLGISNSAPDVATAMSGSILIGFYELLEGVSFLCEFNQLDVRKCQKILSVLQANFGVTFTGTAATGIFSEIIKIFLTTADRCGVLGLTIGPDPFTSSDLRRINIFLGKAHNLFNCLKKTFHNVAKLKKWLYKGLNEIFTLLRAGNFGGQAVFVQSDRTVSVYTLSGQLKEQQRGGLNTARLANGVYLVVSESAKPDGTKKMEMLRLVITH